MTRSRFLAGLIGFACIGFVGACEESAEYEFGDVLPLRECEFPARRGVVRQPSLEGGNLSVTLAGCDGPLESEGGRACWSGEFEADPDGTDLPIARIEIDVLTESDGCLANGDEIWAGGRVFDLGPIRDAWEAGGGDVPAAVTLLVRDQAIDFPFE